MFLALSVTIVSGGNIVWYVCAYMLWWHFYDLICVPLWFVCLLVIAIYIGWALTLWSVVVRVHECNIRTIDSRISLSRWLICIVGCFTHAFRRYKR